VEISRARYAGVFYLPALRGSRDATGRKLGSSVSGIRRFRTREILSLLAIPGASARRAAAIVPRNCRSDCPGQLHGAQFFMSAGRTVSRKANGMRRT